MHSSSAERREDLNDSFLSAYAVKPRTGTNTLKRSSGRGSAGLVAMDLGFPLAILNSQGLKIFQFLSFVTYLGRSAHRTNFSFHSLTRFRYDNLQKRE